MTSNVITIFVDSVTWESVGTTRSSVSPTPFLDSLKRESLTASNLYSHGPYTDAAKTCLLTGRNCLDDFGYYYRENSSPTSHLKLFHDAGYETYCFHYPFWIYGNKIRRYIDHLIYTAGFVFGSEWGGMFGHYSEIASKRDLTDDELKLLSIRFRLFFEAYTNYVDEILCNDEASMLHGDSINRENYLRAKELLGKEFEKFNENSIDYINDFNKQGMNHPVAALQLWSIDDLVSRDFLEEMLHENKDFYKKITRQNYRANFWKVMPSFRRLLWAIIRYIKTKNKDNLFFLLNYKFLLHPFEEMRSVWGKPKWQVSNSIHSVLKSGLEVLKKRDNGASRPFYMYLNTDDPHKNIAMFAYDVKDKKVVGDELRVLNEYVEQVGTKFKGSLLYFLSLRYVDYEIEKFSLNLQKLGLWENTSLLVLTDHGSSFTYYPLHNARVNCFYDECYHIPVLLRAPGFKGINVDTYQTSKDIFPTVCDMVGLDKPSEFNGHSMLDFSRPIQSYVITEYMGPGCPDMTTKRMWLSIRDTNYLIGYKVGVFEPFNEGDLAEVYDLKKDPLAYYNINTIIEKNVIDYLLKPLEERFNQIKLETNAFLQHIDVIEKNL